jgi:hypothetical protein
LAQQAQGRRRICPAIDFKNLPLGQTTSTINHRPPNQQKRDDGVGIFAQGFLSKEPICKKRVVVRVLGPTQFWSQPMKRQKG